MSQQTRYVLVRFKEISPTAVTNLSSFITVTGTNSGVHPGQTHIATDARTVIYAMTNDFASNEVVTVSLNPEVETGAGGTVAPYEYQCAITGPIPPFGSNSVVMAAQTATPEIPETSPTVESSRSRRAPVASQGHAGLMPNGVSVPSDFPHVNITVNDNPDDQYIFINLFSPPYYNVIFDNNGSPVWYQKFPFDRRDMKVQPNGVLTMVTRTNGLQFIGLDNHYRPIATYEAVNGYTTDEHELQVLKDGTYLLIGWRDNYVDMSKYVSGGQNPARVTASVIQEFTAAGELIFQWRAWDHFDIRDLNLQPPTGPNMDFPHMNAIDIDTDGNILLSSRHLSEVTKINRDSGEIIWRLGGAHNQFAYVNDPLNGPQNQHAIRVVGTNDYLMFDNGDLHSPPVSRAVEYVLDLTNMTATVVWQYPATPTQSIYAFYMGNAQRLTNGNTLINWALGNLPKLTEVRPDGTKAFEMNWVNRYQTYRTWRCSWNGVALKPNLIIESYPEYLLLLFNKFGDTNVGYYRIYGGTTTNPTQVLATSSISLATLRNLENQQQYYFRVTAVDKNGVESDFSDEQSAYVNLIKPSENMIVNPDFSNNTSPWIWTVSGTAAATWSLSDTGGVFTISNPGSSLTDIQLSQAGLKLLQGRKYVLEFDAWADQPRTMEARLGENYNLGTTYEIASSTLTPGRQHFRYPFTMDSGDDLNARLDFNLGGAIGTVHLDHVSLYLVAAGDLDQDQCVGLDDLKTWASQWLQQGAGLTSDLDGDEKVDFDDFETLGADWLGGNCP